MSSDLDLGRPAVVRMIDHPNTEPSQPVLYLAQHIKIEAVALMCVMLLVHRSRFLAGSRW